MLTKLIVNLKSNIVEDLASFLEYSQNLVIMQELKNYRPKRRPVTKHIENETNEVKEKKLLIVRDWFFYAIWANRIKKVIKANKKSQDPKTTKLKEFKKLYSRIIPSPIKKIKTEVLPDEETDDYLKWLEILLGQQKGEKKANFIKILTTYSGIKFATRMQEITLKIYPSNEAGAKFPLYELQINVCLYA